MKMATEILKEHSSNLLEGLNKLPTSDFLFKETKKTESELGIDNDRKKKFQEYLDDFLNNIEWDEEKYGEDVINFLKFDYDSHIKESFLNILGKDFFEAIKNISNSSNSYDKLTNDEKLDLYKLICLLSATITSYECYILSYKEGFKDNYELCKLNLERKIKSMKMNQ